MRFALAGGGTGGHVYPAVAVAECLRASEGTELYYYGTERGPEHEVAEREGYVFRAVPAAQVRVRSPLRLARGLFRLWQGTRVAGDWLDRDRPSAVFVTGGYAAAPVGRAAKRRNIPLIVFLPDARPGWAVRFLARYATTIACAVEASVSSLPKGKTVVTGYPVRRQFLDATRAEGQQRFGLDAHLPTLLVGGGGSIGAHAINLVVSRALPRWLEGAQVIHICGRDEEHWLAKERMRLPEWQRNRYHLHAYTEEMAYAMAASDLAVTRGGASTLGELPALALPAIVIPGAYSDQDVNAAFLAGTGGAVHLPPERIDELEALVLDLLGDRPRRDAMSDAMRGLARRDAAERLAQMLREVAA
ncbi:MAG: UDP-N-acetylglucosamine--N-acetylmuramyl-(pentapeptide) pyrophosphoryl-undecaprenol N-acetylglucosamine transferase [Chloroflexi bacterium]|nr:UDP-N-acetylglucosamine--N-acetylmuramyl-(pentapeptide) pyrophosphoryl-undecaprenol N-acetylglucosamine transferase [Chloroflexota bacterium]MDA1240716.1 UDP-N-acetylglucosamine--N-acetylmuramyl-(pentapeptide) pyrophosphoryl-undecaprenol N-acetylglucosamine transferase [Chloroflexota bacterium]MQC25635.1 UDP-N-acetylglucosamine--N-acetylmuramyl-(pentapeptide) pyrophosphoryl-undecaprenol N-acetylglucosamine transferase [Chloroflexota bacterium]MQC47973.1 UDP-N-acetylglucosamine--N-acetylmuramy